MKRASGLLLHITSLPSPYGVGTLGKAAYDFVDYLHRARQRYWQILPLTPTGYGDSPYQSASTFAGNPYLVDLDLLKEQGLLTDEDIGADWGGDPRKVDFGLLYNRRRAVLEKAFARFDRSKMADYVADHAWYLKDWTLFCALKDRFEGSCIGSQRSRIYLLYGHKQSNASLSLRAVYRLIKPRFRSSLCLIRKMGKYIYCGHVCCDGWQTKYIFSSFPGS